MKLNKYQNKYLYNSHQYKNMSHKTQNIHCSMNMKYKMIHPFEKYNHHRLYSTFNPNYNIQYLLNSLMLHHMYTHQIKNKIEVY